MLQNGREIQGWILRVRIAVQKSTFEEGTYDVIWLQTWWSKFIQRNLMSLPAMGYKGKASAVYCVDSFCLLRSIII